MAVLKSYWGSGIRKVLVAKGMLVTYFDVNIPPRKVSIITFNFDKI
jgi:hypothetical protein